jgi:hypothetical protein
MTLLEQETTLIVVKVTGGHMEMEHFTAVAIARNNTKLQKGHVLE